MASVALVTGASSGIGGHTAVALQELGYTVYAVARRTDRLAGLQARGIRTFAMDLTDDAAIVAGVERILEAEGSIDLLINSAGYAAYGSLEDVPPEEARRQMEVNVFGLARLIQLALPNMRRQGHGRIVNISSIGGKFYEPLGSWYHASKFAVEGLSDSLRLELRPFGIDVVIVEPGPILTEWSTIAREGLWARSAGTVYAGQARTVERVLAGSDRSFTGSSPRLVARVIVKAATSARPRARYVAGRGAGTVLAARRLLPDRIMDALVSRIYLGRRTESGH